MKPNPKTRKQIVLLAKKYKLMPVLYDFNKMLSDPNIKYTRNAMEYLQVYADKNKPGAIKKVIGTLELHKSLTDWARNKK